MRRLRSASAALLCLWPRALLVWRDLENDFGGDLLGKHYAEDHRRRKRPV